MALEKTIEIACRKKAALLAESCFPEPLNGASALPVRGKHRSNVIVKGRDEVGTDIAVTGFGSRTAPEDLLCHAAPIRRFMRRKEEHPDFILPLSALMFRTRHLYAPNLSYNYASHAV